MTQLTANSPYNTEYETKCNCRCDYTIDCGEWDCGKHKLMVYLKCIIEVIAFGLFITQTVFGGIYLGDNLYSNVTNNSICNIEQGTYVTIDAQKLLFVTGILGALMILFRIIHFASVLHLSEYEHTITALSVSHWAFFLLTAIFTIIQITFLLKTCSYFEKLFNVYILSLIYNSVVTSILFSLLVYEFFFPTITDLRAILTAEGTKK